MDFEKDMIIKKYYTNGLWNDVFIGRLISWKHKTKFN